jgi:hypothetical protein
VIRKEARGTIDKKALSLIQEIIIEKMEFLALLRK